jgi:hypothetical protein
LREAGRLDDALRASLSVSRRCPGAEIASLEARLPVLEQLGDSRGLLEAAKRVRSSKHATPGGRQHAERILRAPPKPVDDFTLAREATQSGLRLSFVERRAALDTALLAYERASGKRAEVVALRAMRGLQMLDATTLVVMVKTVPHDEFFPAVISLTTGDDQVPHGAAFRLLRGGAVAPGVSVSSDGTIVTSSEGRGFVYPAPTAPARALPPAMMHAALAHGRVVVADSDWVLLQDVASGKELVTKTKTTAGEATLRRAQLSADQRFWVACAPPGDDPTGVVAVDARKGAVTVNLPTADGCAFDAKRGTLAVLFRGAPHATLELIPVDGAKSIRVPLPHVRDLNDVRLNMNTARGVVFVQRADKQTIVQLSTGRLLPRIPPETPVGPPALRGVSIGSAGETPASVRPLRRLAAPPRVVVEPAFATVQSWTANGVMSFDGRTVAAYTANRRDEDIKLVIADAATLKVRHRIDVPYGVNWLTAFFIDNRLLVAQSYPTYMVFDAHSGEFLANIEDQDMQLVFGRYLLAGANLWDTGPRKSKAERLVDLGLEDGGSWSGNASKREWRRSKEAPDFLRFSEDGSVMFKGMDPPPFVYCRFGQWLAPFPVCEHRFKP